MPGMHSPLDSLISFKIQVKHHLLHDAFPDALQILVPSSSQLISALCGAELLTLELEDLDSNPVPDANYLFDLGQII